LISFSRRLVSDHGSAALGIASVRMKMAKVAVSRQMFPEILSLIARLRAPPAPA
jgi:hypothetical protein